MANEKWSSFPTQSAPAAGDKLVGIHSGSNVQFSGLGAVLYNPPSDQTISAHDLTLTSGNFYASRITANSGTFIGGSVSGGAQGIITLYSPTAAKGTLQLYASDNSSVFNVNITNASFSRSSTLTINDPGTSTATIVLGQSFTPYGVLCAGTTATNKIQSTASVGTVGQFLGSNGASALPSMMAVLGRLLNIQVFTTSATYTPTSGATHAIVWCIGGGGGGGGAQSPSFATGGGGGGTSIAYLTSLSPQSVTIGGGGTGGVAPNDGTAGGTTSFGSICQATGGSGGVGTIASAAGLGVPGGVGSGGIINISGSDGQSGATVGGCGGGTLLAGLSASGSFLTSPSSGYAYGGGGQGGAAIGFDQNGAIGASGVIIVYEYS